MSDTIQGNHTATTALDTLRSHVSKLPVGPLSGDAAQTVIKLLGVSWGDIEGSTQDSTWSYKLRRAENLQWDPPKLTFTLERHGGTVLGSTRAELHNWFVDVNKGVATMAPAGRRQLYPMDLPFTKNAARKLAIEILGFIRKGKKDERLKWHADGSVSVILTRCVQARFAATRTNRKRILVSQLIPVLEEVGWVRTLIGSGYKFCKADAPSSGAADR